MISSTARQLKPIVAKALLTRDLETTVETAAMGGREGERSLGPLALGTTGSVFVDVEPRLVLLVKPVDVVISAI